MEQNHNSWENFFRDDSSNMLEDALPYLPPMLKKTAAMYIKLTELSKIANEFDNEQTLSACGLDQDNASIEMLLNAMKMRAPKETASQINQILQIMEMMKLYQNYQNFINTNPEAVSSLPSNTENDTFSKLMPLLMSQNQKASPSPNSDFMNQLNQILNK